MKPLLGGELSVRVLKLEIRIDTFNKIKGKRAKQNIYKKKGNLNSVKEYVVNYGFFVVKQMLDEKM